MHLVCTWHVLVHLACTGERTCNVNIAPRIISAGSDVLQEELAGFWQGQPLRQAQVGHLQSSTQSLLHADAAH